MAFFNVKNLHNITYILSVLLLIFYSSVALANMNDAEEIFEQAWNKPEYTQMKLDDININETLSKYYKTPKPVNFTRQMLWDVETKKAWDPKTYISYIVKEGKSWGKKLLPNGDETFVRSSQQKQWLNREKYEQVFEEVYLNHKDQRATFIGTQNLKDSSGEWLHIKNQQPLFHVQHSVEGEEDTPINVWRIVHLTEEKDQKLIEHFNDFKSSTALPGFVEKYIQKDLHIPLTYKYN